MSHGQGSITQDKRNGKWLARYRGPDGRQRSKTFDRKTDARAFLSTMHADKIRGTWIDPTGAQTPFEDWAEQWFAARHGLDEASLLRDQSLYRNHVLPTFGRTPLGRIGPLDVRAWVNDLQAKGLKPRTVRGCYGIFAAIMRSAASARVIGEAPLGQGIVSLPKIERKRERFLTEQEVDALAAELGPDYSAIVITAAYTGCRWQELAGLKRCFLDLDAGKIHVRGVLKHVSGGKTVWRECPKSDESRRSVTLPPFLVQLLRDHLEAQPLGEWVFTAPKGGILNEANFRRPWNKAVAATGLGPLTFHDTRHTHAAWLIRDGIQPLALQRRLGHRDIRTTMNVYGHLFPNFEDDLVATLDRRWEEARSSESAKLISLNAN